MRDYDIHDGYADSVNRRARWGLLLIVAIVAGVAFGANALDADKASPPPSVLPTQLIAERFDPLDFEAAATSTTLGLVGVRRPSALSPTPTPASPTTVAPTTTSTSTTRPAQTTAPTTVRSTSTTSVTTTTTTTPTTTTVPPTTTTTTVPSTTTTTIPPVLGTVHLHDLKGDAKINGDGPYARIEVQIRNDLDRRQQGVLVTGLFDDGHTGIVTGTTDKRGKVIFESGIIEGGSVIFTVTSLDHPDYVYAPEDNRREPSVTVEFD